jgi:hypothetical protein
MSEDIRIPKGETLEKTHLFKEVFTTREGATVLAYMLHELGIFLPTDAPSYDPALRDYGLKLMKRVSGFNTHTNDAMFAAFAEQAHNMDYAAIKKRFDAESKKQKGGRK